MVSWSLYWMLKQASTLQRDYVVIECLLLGLFSKTIFLMWCQVMHCIGFYIIVYLHCTLCMWMWDMQWIYKSCYLDKLYFVTSTLQFHGEVYSCCTKECCKTYRISSLPDVKGDLLKTDNYKELWLHYIQKSNGTSGFTLVQIPVNAFKHKSSWEC